MCYFCFSVQILQPILDLHVQETKITIIPSQNTTYLFNLSKTSFLIFPVIPELHSSC